MKLIPQGWNLDQNCLSKQFFDVTKIHSTTLQNLKEKISRAVTNGEF